MAFWEVAAAQGKSCGILNVPVSFPPRPFPKGFMVSGMLSPRMDRRAVYPPEILDELLADSPHYAPNLSIMRRPGIAPKLACIDRAVDTVRWRLEGTLHLMRRHALDLLCVVFVASDRVCHYFWGEMEMARQGKLGAGKERPLGSAILRVYEALDEAVGSLMHEAGDDTDVLILSDHGAGPLRKGLSLRNLLAEHGLLTRRKPGRLARLRNRVLHTCARVMPASVQTGLKSRLRGLSERFAAAVAHTGVDLERTRTYPVGYAEGIFVNLKGRQPAGTVEPGSEYESVRDDVIAVLSQLKDPDTGQPVARRVQRREDIWSGPCVHLLPDVVMEQCEKIYDVETFPERAGDEPFYSLPAPDPGRWLRLGAHRPYGVLLATGPHIQRAQPADPRIADVPATALVLLGCDMPEEMDGRALTEVLSDDVGPVGVFSAEAAQYGGRQERFSEDDRRSVESRLKDLGYM
jgi:predicted AlkP superfamily phosphohydrolase/phosphomutase